MRDLRNLLIVFGSIVGFLTVEAQSYYRYNSYSYYTSYSTYNDTLVYVGAIVGGVVFIAAIAITVVACICCRRQRGATGAVIHSTSNPTQVVFSTSQPGQHLPGILAQQPTFYQTQQNTSQLQLLSQGLHPHQPFQQNTGNLRPLRMLNRAISSAPSLQDLGTLQDFGSLLQDSVTGMDSLMSSCEDVF
ncbi:uncharacterized protein LOC133200949 [Saccostrea echinata]|uniref:uncharacterized protein LOC133200949 n=1 Tax=Saccostrea echinata TaxID=191078 RepID=UPI002A822096|nr:uncharacterized protein LOC133200949 [Saccostrea echinata]